MFIKLTKLDNSPIWINAAFVVTVEPRKGGGAIVVPVGDGLDYDVRETPEKVLSMLGDAPAPAILPIPTTDALTATPEDVSAESDLQLTAEARQTPVREEPRAPVVESPVEEAAAVPTGGASSEADSSAPDASVSSDAPASDSSEEKVAEEKPAKATRKTAAKKPRTTRKKKLEFSFTEEEILRLKKMAPGSIKKLQNTLQAQFKVEDVEGAVKALEQNGVLTLERDRVIWVNEGARVGGEGAPRIAPASQLASLGGYAET